MRIIRANQRFVAEVRRSQCTGCGSLPSPLDDIIKEGLMEFNGCIVLKALLKRSPGLRLSDFPDKTGAECFVNHIHVGDYASTGKLETAFGFFYALAEIAPRSKVAMPLSGIISVDDSSVAIRFHAVRHGEKWLCDDLEQYQCEGVAEVDIYSPEHMDKRDFTLGEMTIDISKFILDASRRQEGARVDD